MKHSTIWVLTALAIPLPAGAQAVKTPAEPAQVLSCDFPVNARDTAKSLLARYKGAKRARRSAMSTSPTAWKVVCGCFRTKAGAKST